MMSVGVCSQWHLQIADEGSFNPVKTPQRGFTFLLLVNQVAVIFCHR